MLKSGPCQQTPEDRTAVLLTTVAAVYRCNREDVPEEGIPADVIAMVMGERDEL
jgi:hypothetical protein